MILSDFYWRKYYFARMELKHYEIYQKLFESAAEGLVLVDSNGRINLVNESLLNMFGYSQDELIGEKIEALIPRKHHSSHVKKRADYNKAPKKRRMGQGMNLAAVKKDGTEFPVEISLNFIPTENGNSTMGLVTDITTRKIIEEENRTIREESKQQLLKINRELDARIKERTAKLEENQKLYKAIAKNFPEGTINVLDTNFNYVFTDGKELHKLGLTSEDLVGTNYVERMPSNLKPELDSCLEKSLNGAKQTSEIKLGTQHYLLDIVPLSNSMGEIDRILVVERNITERKNNEDEVIKNLEKEKELNELKTRFVSMASHEFRTPLGTILSSASLIGKYVNTEDQDKRDKHVKRIKTSVSDLTSILNDFLSLEKLESGKIEINPVHVDVKQTCENIVEDMQSVCKKGQMIHYRHSGDSRAFLDELLFKNILLNLISNAIKYSSESSTIELSTACSRDELNLAVEDNGIGIPEKDQPHLFERFFRAKNATNIQGTGLGLNIVKKYVSSMNGDISYKSKEGEGTSFIVNFKLMNQNAE